MAILGLKLAAERRLNCNTVVASVMSNFGLEQALKPAGIRLVRTEVGDPAVAREMRTNGYNLGGEQSGHIILSDYTTTGDGFVAALQVLAVVKKSGKPVSEACHRFEPLPQILKNVRYKSGKPLEDAKVKTAIASAQKKLDGQGRLVIRPSGTEPVIRVMGEGDDRELVEAAVDHVVEALAAAAA
jgi:phosphoglucosamine mutase